MKVKHKIMKIKNKNKNHEHGKYNFDKKVPQGNSVHISLLNIMK